MQLRPPFAPDRSPQSPPDAGATMAEYVLAVMLIALVGLVGATLLGDAVLAKFLDADLLWPS